MHRGTPSAEDSTRGGKTRKKGYGKIDSQSPSLEEVSLASPTKGIVGGTKTKKPSFKLHPSKDKSKKSRDQFLQAQQTNKMRTRPPGSTVPVPVVMMPKHMQQFFEEHRIFGVSLSVVAKSQDGVELPVIFRECIDFLEDNLAHCEDIYRASGKRAEIDKLKLQYEAGELVTFAECGVHEVAGLLLKYLHSLPQSLISSQSQVRRLEDVIEHPREKAVGDVADLLSALPPVNKTTLSWFITHLRHLSDKFDSDLAEKIAPKMKMTLIIDPKVIAFLIRNAYSLWPELELKRYVPEWMARLPETIDAIERQLLEHEKRLEKLHKQMDAGGSEEVTDALWEQQQVVTLMKRRLKQLTRLANQQASTDATAVENQGDEMAKQLRSELKELIKMMKPGTNAATAGTSTTGSSRSMGPTRSQEQQPTERRPEKDKASTPGDETRTFIPPPPQQEKDTPLDALRTKSLTDSLPPGNSAMAQLHAERLIYEDLCRQAHTEIEMEKAEIDRLQAQLTESGSEAESLPVEALSLNNKALETETRLLLQQVLREKEENVKLRVRLQLAAC